MQPFDVAIGGEIKEPKPFTAETINADLQSSIVVVLVALPLCLGIATACDCPPTAGLITGIVGGIITGSIAGCPLQVSGPAAGLTPLVFGIVREQGLERLGLLVMITGFFQLGMGFAKVGKYFRAVSPAVVQAMMSGIGFTIFFGQMHGMFDQKPQGSVMANVLALPQTFGMAGEGGGPLGALVISLCVIGFLVMWDYYGIGSKTIVPGQLVAIFLAAVVQLLIQFDITKTQVPGHIHEDIMIPDFTLLPTILTDYNCWNHIVSLTLIASAETLLSVSAVDSMHEMKRADMDQELVAQGVGNSIAGLLGAMPMTGVIIRSSANVKAGAKTKASTIIHGMFLLVISTFLCKQIELIPKCALSALLVHTGFNLVYKCPFAKIRKGGDRELVFYGLSVLMILMTDLLTGVLFGVFLALVNLSYKMLRMDSVIVSGAGNSVTVKLMGASGFTALTTLTPTLEGIPPRQDVSIDTTALLHIDASCIDMIEQWERRYTAQGGTVSVKWNELELRKQMYVDRMMEEHSDLRSRVQNTQGSSDLTQGRSVAGAA
jgi:MFS superfamily sulfate permease-like transporter